MTSKSKSTQSPAPSVEPAFQVPRGYYVTAWSVRGRGKSATYCALMPHGLGEPGQRVALIAKSGAVTLARLAEIHEMGDASDAGNRWTFTRETMSPDQQRANRAAKSAATASYWASDAGLATAERIAQRQSKSEPADTEPASEPTPEPTAPREPTASDEIATTVAMLIAGGMSPADAAAVGVAMRASESDSQRARESERAQQSKSPRAPQQSKSKSPAKSEPADVLERCDACNRERRGCAEHRGDSSLLVCPRCASLDTDTAQRRAARHK